jgi:hypothetical protein
MKCIHKNDGENKIETNSEVYCDEKLLIKSDSVYFLLSQTCGVGHCYWQVTGQAASGQITRSPDHQTALGDAQCKREAEWIRLSDKVAPRGAEFTAVLGTGTDT